METSSNRRIVKNTTFLYVRMFLTMGVGLYTSRLVLEVLGVENYGIYNVIGGIVALFTIINGAVSVGSSRFLTFEIGKNNIQGLKKTFSVSFAIHLAVALIVLILSETVGLWFINTQLVIPADRMFAANCVYQFSIISCIVGLIQVPYNAIVIAHERMHIYAYFGIYDVVAKLILVFCLFYVSSVDVLILYGIVICVSNFTVAFLYYAYCRYQFQETKLEVVKEKSYYQSMLSFSLWDIVGAFCTTGNSQGVNVLMNLFFGITVNAARGVAGQVENSLSLFSRNFLTAVQPQLVKLFAENKLGKMLQLMFDSSKYSSFLFFLVAFPVMLDTRYILGLWLKEVPDFSVIFLRCTIIASLIRVFAIPVVQAIHASGNIKWLNIYCGGACILLTLPAIYILYKLGYPPQYGYYTIIGVNLLCNYLELFILNHEIKFSIWNYSLQVYLRAIGILFLSTLPTLLLKQYMDESFIRLVLLCLSHFFWLLLFVLILGIGQDTRRKLYVLLKNYVK